MTEHEAWKTQLVGHLKENDLEQGIRLLEQEIDLIQREAFLQGYQYAITILQDTLVGTKKDSSES